MKRIGIAALALGIIVLLYDGYASSRQRTIVDLGGIHATVTEHHDIPSAPIVGGIMVIGGLLLLVVPSRRVS
jgi:hypothetical protein